MGEDSRYLVCGCTPWARRIFEQTISKFPGQWNYVAAPEALRRVLPPSIVRPPEYVFFLHWRWKVPETIVRRYWCIGFHLGKLPQQAGGSPLQWRILEGQTEADLTEFQMTSELDAGPVFSVRTVSLHGSAEAIYARAMEATATLIRWRINHPPEVLLPVSGERTVYPRRTPEKSRLPQNLSLSGIYDRIRMLDAEGYPNAFLDYSGMRFTLRFTFRRAVEYDGRIEADVTITEIPA